VIEVALLLSALALAFANGANDNFKGVATLLGSRRLSYRRALALATVSTAAGSAAAMVLATGLARRFSGRGLVPDAVALEPAFLLAVALGAGGTVLLATRLGFPISTTHALTGALLGVGLVMAGPARISFGVLGASFLAPLVASPFVALVLAASLRAPLLRVASRRGWTEPSCLCAAPEPAPLAGVPRGAFAGRVGPRRLELGSLESCAQHGATPLLTVAPRGVADSLHVLSAGAVGFARGLNDTPKMAGLLLGTQVISDGLGTPAVAAAIAIGGLLAARRVARTLSFGITAMDGTEGLGANIVTAALVVLASPLGLPVSTTHVSCGALFGIGAANGRGRWRMIGAVVAAWVITLPVAAVLGALAGAGFR